MIVKNKKWLLTFEVMDDGINDEGKIGDYLPQHSLVEAITKLDLPSRIAVRYVGGFEITE